MVDPSCLLLRSSRVYADREQTPRQIEELSAHTFELGSCWGRQILELEQPLTQTGQECGFGHAGAARLRGSLL